MNFTKLFAAQQALDTHIEQEKNLQDVDCFEKKVAAVLVEIGETLNELPEEFKFWSHKKNERKKALKELVDILHFLLSLGLEMGFDTELKEIPVMKKETVTKQFIHLFYLTSAFTWFNNLKQYELMMGYFVGLGEMLNFTWDQVEVAYFEKNRINHERQENSY